LLYSTTSTRVDLFFFLLVKTAATHPYLFHHQPSPCFRCQLCVLLLRRLRCHHKISFLFGCQSNSTTYTSIHIFLNKFLKAILKKKKMRLFLATATLGLFLVDKSAAQDATSSPNATASSGNNILHILHINDHVCVSTAFSFGLKLLVLCCSYYVVLMILTQNRLPSYSSIHSFYHQFTAALSLF